MIHTLSGSVCDRAFHRSVALSVCLPPPSPFPCLCRSHTHQGTDKTYWQSGPRESWEEIVQDTGRNLAQEMIDDAHANGARMIAYHYTRCHAYWSKAEPEWW
jgi:hypothetical protein